MRIEGKRLTCVINLSFGSVFLVLFEATEDDNGLVRLAGSKSGKNGGILVFKKCKSARNSDIRGKSV